VAQNLVGHLLELLELLERGKETVTRDGLLVPILHDDECQAYAEKQLDRISKAGDERHDAMFAVAIAPQLGNATTKR
jgi:bacterioferritin (cytochrome b1)